MGKIRILLDTNIVIDYFTGRMADGIAERIIAVNETPEYELVISMLTALNTLYVAKKSSLLTPEVLERLFRIEPQTSEQWDMAKTYKMPDFEDAIQAACAVSANCTLIISRDRHFINSPVKTISPLSFIQMVY